MQSVLFSIYGPIAINSYGFFISLGVITFVFCIRQDKKCIKNDIDKQITQIIYIGFLGAFFGGKITHYALETTSSIDWLDIALPWRGGFSILGSITGALSTLLIYLSKTKNGIFLSLDCIAPYIPLLQSMGRVGCFFAGCCYGKPCNMGYAIPFVTPTLEMHAIPFLITRHPTQLYSAFLLVIIFFYLLTQKNKPSLRHGNLTIQYVLLVSAERFIIDYWREERTFALLLQTLSYNQWLALFLFVLSVLAYIFLIFYYKQKLKCS